MKKVSTYIALALWGSCFLTACNDAEYDSTKNSVYVAEAQEGNLKKITVDENGGKATVTVRSAAFYDKDVKVKIGPASEQELAEFNKKNGTAYIALSANNYKLSENEVIIKKGQVTAPTIEVAIDPLTKEQIESGDKYVVPLSIVSADESVLGSSKSMFYAIDQVIITTAPYLKSGNGISIKMPGAGIKTLAWTLEYRIWVETLFTTNTAQGVSWWGAGPATEIYFRWGDANVPGNLIMTKTQGGQFISTKPAKSGQWYHHAWVHDGKTVKLYINGEYDAQMDSPGKMSELDDETTLGTGSQPYMYSEWRFWSVARTQKQIKENMFSVNPQSNGLEIYLKLNEGTGKTFKEYVGKYKASAEANKDFEWRTIRSDQQ